jgi:hypothetical protein
MAPLGGKWLPWLEPEKGPGMTDLGSIEEHEMALRTLGRIAGLTRCEHLEMWDRLQFIHEVTVRAILGLLGGERVDAGEQA